MMNDKARNPLTDGSESQNIGLIVLGDWTGQGVSAIAELQEVRYNGGNSGPACTLWQSAQEQFRTSYMGLRLSCSTQCGMGGCGVGAAEHMIA